MSDQVEIPKYADSAPPVNENCQGQGVNNGLNIISPPSSGGGGGLPTEVTPGFSIQVTDNSNTEKYSFEVAYSPYTPVDVTLSIITRVSSVLVDSTAASPCLKGTVIDEVECNWSYNPERDGDIATQSIVNTGAGSDPSLIGTDRTYTYNSLTIQDDSSVTITGADDQSTDNDTDNIVFGNYVAVGVSDPSLLLRNPSEAQAIFDALVTKDIRTTQAGYSFNAFGASTEFMVIAHPASWGESEFTKGVFTGGYFRIYSVNRGGNDIFTNEVIAGDVENQININNGNNGFTEEFYFYMSEFPERTGNEPTIMSKV